MIVLSSRIDDYYIDHMYSTSALCTTSAAMYHPEPAWSSAAHQRCSYCGRSQKWPDDGRCMGCGGPRPMGILK